MPREGEINMGCMAAVIVRLGAAGRIGGLPPPGRFVDLR